MRPSRVARLVVVLMLGMPACSRPADTVTTTRPAEPGFDRVLTLEGVSFHVSCPNDSSINTLTLVPAGLTIDSRPIVRTVDGWVIDAAISDLDADGSPEIWVYIQSAGSGSYGSLVAYAVDNGARLSAITLPPVIENPSASAGYMGHDRFSIVGSRFVQRFPIYAAEDTNAAPSGPMRRLEYRLARAEEGWRLVLDRVLDE